MKKYIIALLMVLIFAESYSQTPGNQLLSKDYYLQKSKNQNSTGWTLFLCGTAMAVGGFIGFSKYFDIWGGSDAQARKADRYGFIFTTGVVCDLISIPFFLSAAKHRRKAATIALINDQIYLPLQSKFVLTSVPAFSLKINF